jgi:hypothetical protein
MLQIMASSAFYLIPKKTAVHLLQKPDRSQKVFLMLPNRYCPGPLNS